MIILKIGGSAFSNKSTGKSYIKRVSKIVADELPKKEKLVIVVGAGYIGHSIAKKYKLFNLNNNQHEWAYLHGKVAKNAILFVNELVKNGHPAIHLSLAGLMSSKDGVLSNIELKHIKKFVEQGFIPVVHSDYAFDLTRGGAPISGDDIATVLAHKLNASTLIFGSDVDGIFDKDGNVIKKLKISDINNIRFWKSNKIDINGGMIKKINSIKSLLKKDHNINVKIINLRKKNMLKNAINGKEVGTLFVL